MEKFVLYNGKKYFIHPIYKKYAAMMKVKLFMLNWENREKAILLIAATSKLQFVWKKTRQKHIYLIDSFSSAFTV